MVASGCSSIIFGLQENTVRPTAVKWSVGIAAFFLPGLLGIVGDALSRSPATNGSLFVKGLPGMFVLSVILAAGVCTGTIMTVPISFGRRLGFVTGVWCTLLAEAWLTMVWSLRGLH
jgi:hypothetical protein